MSHNLASIVIQYGHHHALLGECFSMTINANHPFLSLSNTNKLDASSSCSCLHASLERGRLCSVLYSKIGGSASQLGVSLLLSFSSLFQCILILLVKNKRMSNARTALAEVADDGAFKRSDSAWRNWISRGAFCWLAVRVHPPF